MQLGLFQGVSRPANMTDSKRMFYSWNQRNFGKKIGSARTGVWKSESWVIFWRPLLVKKWNSKEMIKLGHLACAPMLCPWGGARYTKSNSLFSAPGQFLLVLFTGSSQIRHLQPTVFPWALSQRIAHRHLLRHGGKIEAISCEPSTSCPGSQRYVYTTCASFPLTISLPTSHWAGGQTLPSHHLTKPRLYLSVVVSYLFYLLFS